jgi:hypothetical protein
VQQAMITGQMVNIGPKMFGGETNQSEFKKCTAACKQAKTKMTQSCSLFLLPGRIQLNLQGKECIKLFNTVLINLEKVYLTL